MCVQLRISRDSLRADTEILGEISDETCVDPTPSHNRMARDSTKRDARAITPGGGSRLRDPRLYRSCTAFPAPADARSTVSRTADIAAAKSGGVTRITATSGCPHRVVSGCQPKESPPSPHVRSRKASSHRVAEAANTHAVHLRLRSRIRDWPYRASSTVVGLTGQISEFMPRFTNTMARPVVYGADSGVGSGAT